MLVTYIGYTVMSYIGFANNITCTENNSTVQIITFSTLVRLILYLVKAFQRALLLLACMCFCCCCCCLSSLSHILKRGFFHTVSKMRKTLAERPRESSNRKRVRAKPSASSYAICLLHVHPGALDAASYKFTCPLSLWAFRLCTLSHAVAYFSNCACASGERECTKFSLVISPC